MINAKDIQLSKEAMRLLKQLAKGKKIDWTSIENTQPCQTLWYYSLIYPSRSGKRVFVSEEGMQVLLHHKNEIKTRRQEHRHNWYIAIFSMLGGALLSKPAWTVIDWLVEWLS